MNSTGAMELRQYQEESFCKAEVHLKYNDSQDREMRKGVHTAILYASCTKDLRQAIKQTQDVHALRLKVRETEEK